MDIIYLYCIFVFYALAVISMAFFWPFIKIHRNKLSGEPETTFSIIIPARNEAQNILACLNSVLGQDYPPDLFQVIVVDDHSDDETFQIAETFRQKFAGKGVKFEVTKPFNNIPGKKGAIATGIQKAGNDWIVTTDADTIRDKQWLKVFDDLIRRKNPVLISAPVRFTTSGSLFQRWQALEFASLNAIGAISMWLGFPNICNGANLAYKKSAYKASGGFEGYENIASGDDELLLHKMHKNFPGRLSFLKDKRAIVQTDAPGNILDFIKQRSRWASKGRYYKGGASALPGLFVWMVNFLVVSLIFAAFMGGIGWSSLLIAWSVKAFAEFVFLLMVAPFYGGGRNWYLFWLFQPFYPFYVVIAGLLGTVGNFSWKGRQVKNGKLALPKKDING